jgi:hypothetical protein
MVPKKEVGKNLLREGDPCSNICFPCLKLGLEVVVDRGLYCSEQLENCPEEEQLEAESQLPESQLLESQLLGVW